MAFDDVAVAPACALAPSTFTGDVATALPGEPAGARLVTAIAGIADIKLIPVTSAALADTPTTRRSTRECMTPELA